MHQSVTAHSMNPSSADPFELPASAVETLGDPGIKLQLHGISFSHYVERARWTLRLLGLPFDQVNYLPLLHMPSILALQRRFRQGPGSPTASSKSPAATPCLAIYSATGQPLCLLQDSALICRYAVLRAAALKLPSSADLYGTPALKLAPVSSSSDDCSNRNSTSSSDGQGVAHAGGGAQAAAAGSRRQVAGGDAGIQALEARLGGTLGIEVRRLAYYHLLPLPAVGGLLFTNNSGSSGKLAACIMYYVCRLLLPLALKINAATAARGKEKLLAEFDYLDGLLQEQQQQQQQSGRVATGVAGDDTSNRLPFYLTGPNMSIADIQLACLAAPLLCIPSELSTAWMPPLEALPEELEALVRDLCERPTGKFVVDMWRTHRPKAMHSSS